MIENKYFQKIISKLAFFSVHFRLTAFLIFLIFLFYIAMLGIEITSALSLVPSAADIDKKIPTVNIRKDLIKKIDNFIALKQNINSRLPKKNPFLPYQKDVDNFSEGETIATPVVSPTSVMP